MPSTLPEVLDLQTELWVNASYRQQVRAIRLIGRLIGRLGEAGRTELSEDDSRNRDHHSIHLQEVELQRQRGFWTYVVEDLDVLDAARTLSYSRLSEQYRRSPEPRGPRPVRSAPVDRTDADESRPARES